MTGKSNPQGSNFQGSNLHDEEAFEEAVRKGGLFDVGPNDLDEDIGRQVRFPEAEADPDNNSLYNCKHIIVAVQKDSLSGKTTKDAFATGSSLPETSPKWTQTMTSVESLTPTMSSL